MTFFRLLTAAMLLGAPGARAVAGEAASELAQKEAKLLAAADTLAQMSDQEYEEVARGVWNPGGGRQNPRLRYFASRSAALESVYGTLAAFEFKKALEAGPSGEDKGEVEAALSTRLSDSEAVAVNPETLREAGWWSDVVKGLGESSVGPSDGYRGTAIAGVRGGRKAPSAADGEAAAVRKSLEEAGRALGAGAAGDARAQAHLKRGRLYEKLAAAYAVEKGPAAPAAKAEAPAVPREPTVFSPRAIYQRAGPGVVLIMGLTPDGSGELGTGSVIDDKGSVLTNAHVVIRSATGKPFETLRVYYKPARVTGDPRSDLAEPKTARVVVYDRALDLALV
ncbi:MAG: serine protease, partial [Candidatus Rokubacteria bacterium]|nr:serine protease [Candidatus Rokubacteria bacterium]